MIKTQHYVLGKWTSATGEGKASYDAVTGEFIAETSVEGLDIPAILHYGRTKGGEKLRKMTFQERGKMIPSQVGEIYNVCIGNRSIVGAQRHSRLDVFPMVLKRMLCDFFIS